MPQQKQVATLNKGFLKDNHIIGLPLTQYVTSPA